MTNFYGAVIGAGHNGLTLAAYLARAGLRIAVLERNQRIGGGVNDAPGYIAANTICDDLCLKRNWTPLPPPQWKH